MSSRRKLNLNINEIDMVLNSYYKDKVSITQMSKNMKLSSSKIKNVIKNYSDTFLTKFPQYKPVDDVSVNDYEQYILSGSYTPAKLEIEKKSRTTKVKTDDIIDNSPYVN